METKELRIGSIVTLGNHNSDYLRVEGITKDMVRIPNAEMSWVWVDKSMISPMRITGKLLENCGFENLGKFYEHSDATVYVLHNIIDGSSNFEIQMDDVGKLYPCIDNEACCWSKFEYMHQLQNLFSAMTGFELSCNL